MPDKPIPLKRSLSAESARVIAELQRDRRIDSVEKPLEPGATAPQIPITARTANGLYRLAFARLAGLKAGDVEAVVWADDGSELLVRLARVRVVPLDGYVLVGIPVFT